MNTKNLQDTQPNFREERRNRIILAARDVFFETGYANASMAQIAARVGGSKATLYAYFPSKEDLFEAIVVKQCSRIREFVDGLSSLPDLKDKLRAIGREMITKATSDSLISTFRLVVEESHRNPELARRFAGAISSNGKKALDDLIASAHAAGELNAPNASEAASVLKSLFFRDLHMMRILNSEQSLSEAEIQHRIDLSIDIFMRYYGRESV